MAPPLDRNGHEATGSPVVNRSSGGVALLEIRSATKKFGGVSALKDLDFVIHEKEIVGVIGPNGAGKTSFFNCITGLTPLDEGEMLFRGGRLNGLPPHRILKAGIARTFQNLRVFRNMTALENVVIGFHSRTCGGLLDALARTRRFAVEEKKALAEGAELLRFMGLEAAANEAAASLPYGSQKRLEIARALACGPKLLLLDEPVAGMNPKEKEDIRGLVKKVRDRGIAVILIEHDMNFVMPLSDRVVVMDEGAKIAEGPPAEVQKNPRVIQAYLGEA